MEYAQVVSAVNRIFEEYHVRLTVRQIYYRIISPPFQLFPNDRNHYVGFDYILTRARERGDVDWTRIEDRGREVYGGDSGFKDISEFLTWQIQTIDAAQYRKPMWQDQPTYLEVWVEKDALSQLVRSVASQYYVVTFPTRGYSSFTLIQEALRRMRDYQGKEIKVLDLRDHDPSGIDMSRDAEERLRRYGENLEVHVERIALNIDQVRRFHLAPNPTKAADRRARDYVERFGNECWELDAIPPNEFQAIIRQAIQSNADADLWNRRMREIRTERQRLETFFRMMKPKLLKSMFRAWRKEQGSI
jgi:hypothetical protein